MSRALIISLILFSLTWILIILRCLRKEKISIKYSLIWFLMAVSILLVGILPGFVNSVANFFGFLTVSNLIIGIMISLLMFITLSLTMIVTKQKSQIKNLIQEISMLKKDMK